MTTFQGLIFIGLGVMALGMTVGAFALRSMMIALISSGIWVTLGIYSFAGLSTAAWDVFYAFGFIAIFAGFIVPFGENFAQRKGKPQYSEDDEDYGEVDEDQVQGYRQFHARRRLTDNRRELMDGTHQALLARNLEHHDEVRETKRMARSYPPR